MVNVGIGLALFSQGFSIFATSFTLAYIYIAWAVFFIAMILVLFMIYTVLALTSTEEGERETSDKGHSEMRTNLSAKDKPKVLLYTHSIENHL